MRLLQRVVLATVLATTAPLSRAEACGGCFQVTATGGKTPQVITDHRMILSLSATGTTLWDQIRYAGSPDDFIWVLPVPRGVALDLGLGDNAFVDAVESTSLPRIEASFQRLCPINGAGPSGPPVSTADPWGGGGGGGGGGCGGGPPPSIDYTPGSRGGGNETTPPTGMTMDQFRGSEAVMVGAMEMAVVGPYAVARIGNGPGEEGFSRWAARNGYDIPNETRGAVDHYAALSMDFLVLRLRPEVGIQQMQPVRISYPGYVPQLPLRMIAAGVADKVGLSLMVFAASPVEAEWFENVVIPTSDLVWNFSSNTSNYRRLFDAAILQGRGRVWVTESVQHVTPPMMAMMIGEPDAGADAGTDASAPEMGDGGVTLDRSDRFVDRRIAFAGFPDGRVMLTRMRTELGRVDLSRDLQLRASQRPPLPPLRSVTNAINVPPCPEQPDAGPGWSPPDAGSGSRRGSSEPGWFCAVRQGVGVRWGRAAGPVGVGCVGLALVVRRRRRARTKGA